MPYLNLDLDFLEHPKVVRLSARIGTVAPILLLRLWLWTAKYHPEDGDLSPYTPEEIESFAGYNATSMPEAYAKQCFFDACVDIGLIDVKNQKIRLHDWKKHQGHLLAYKTRAEAAAKARWDKISGKPKERQNDTGNATSIRQAYVKHATSNALLCSTLNSSDLKNTTVGKSPDGDLAKDRFKTERAEEAKTHMIYFENFPFSKNLTERERYKLIGKLIKKCLNRPKVVTEFLHRRCDSLSKIKTEDGFYRYINKPCGDPEFMGECESAAHKEDDGTKRGQTRSIREVMEE
jgi:hypothetical protein